MPACLEPFLARLDDDVPKLAELVRLLYRKSSSRKAGPLGDIARRTADTDDAQIDMHFKGLLELNNHINNISPAVRSCLRSDTKLEAAWLVLQETRREADVELGTGHMILNEGGELGPEAKAGMKDSIQATIEAIVQLRIAAYQPTYR